MSTSRVRSCAAAIAMLLTATSCGRGDRTAPPSDSAPNVILFIGDGFGVGAWAVGRAYAQAHGDTLAMEGSPYVAFLDTRAEDQIVTDSAAAASAWAFGQPGRNGLIGVADTTAPTLFERLAKAGRHCGFITTTRVTHATPAPFYARAKSRDDEDAIAAQLVAAMPDVAIGGGRGYFLPKAKKGHRKDGRDLLEVARANGVAVLDSLQPLPKDADVLLLLADSHLPHAIDDVRGPDLADLVGAAIDKLDASGRGWFLLVEEGRIDHAGHDHDAPAIARDVLRLDRAVAAVLKNVDLASTLVLLTADHGTGNPTLHDHARPDSMDVVRMSVERMEKRIFGDRPWRGTPEALQERALPVLMEGARQPGLSHDDLDRLVEADDEGHRTVALGNAVSRRFGMVFMAYEDHVASDLTGGHTGEPVPVRAWGVRAAEIARLRDHAQLGAWLVDVLGVKTKDAAPAVVASKQK